MRDRPRPHKPQLPPLACVSTTCVFWPCASYCARRRSCMSFWIGSRAVTSLVSASADACACEARSASADVVTCVARVRACAACTSAARCTLPTSTARMASIRAASASRSSFPCAARIASSSRRCRASCSRRSSWRVIAASTRSRTFRVGSRTGSPYASTPGPGLSSAIASQVDHGCQQDLRAARAY